MGRFPEGNWAFQKNFSGVFRAKIDTLRGMRANEERRTIGRIESAA